MGPPRGGNKGPSAAPAAARTPKAKSRSRDSSDPAVALVVAIIVTPDGRESRRPRQQLFLNTGERISGKRCEPHALHGGSARGTLSVRV
ncbi:hypothetical protein HGM15179_009522 [Zosterops borbonicus]|uniref:Uncharacterized protein n=1 Tax=Zosterops borbonicus TaxID=364589 RepID=A0A8K1GFP4_9PASS|nr:hypothetical protein HGM15179_009522 [Zosterops borbonicus]